MLIWICALHCEAKPVIDYYRLKKASGAQAFETWLGDDRVCIVSGIGKLAAATATGWAAARWADQPSLAWINLGTAGGEAEIGDAYLIDRIVDDDTKACYYPVPIARSALPGASCLTLGAPSQDYRADSLFDMEASGFFAAAARFSSAELIQSIKIVSDNPTRQTGRNRQAISELLQAQMDPLAAQAEALLELDREIAGRALPAASFARLLALGHFSVTEQNQARVLWRYLANRHYQADNLLAELTALNGAGAIIARLQQISHRDSESFEHG